MNSKIFSFIFKLIIIIFAVVGFGLLAAYLAVSMHWTDTKGIVDEQADIFWKDSKALASISELTNNNSNNDVFFGEKNYCLMKTIKNEYPEDFARILNLALDNQKDLAQKNLDALVSVLIAGADQTLSSAINSCSDYKNPSASEYNFKVLAGMVDSKNPFVWATSEEWDFFKTGVLKDKDILDKIESETGISKRLLVSELMSEQMRLFYSDRPWFKKVISPLKVLGSMTQFSWGIFGVKEETAQKIEANLKDSNSDFYLGKDFENVLDFKTQNITQERFDRITDRDNHYYAYLYAAIYNKQIISQWEKAGFDISGRPEILATLYNIGFDHSIPNNNPQIGGAELNIGDSVYSFGRLSSEFYYSGELLNEFPQYAKNSIVITKNNYIVPNNQTTDNSNENSTAALSVTVPSQQGISNLSQIVNLLLPIFK